MSDPKGELYIESEEGAPSLVDGWSIERKLNEFYSWLIENYEPEGEYYFTFDEYENADELQDQISNHEEHIEVILKRNWGHRLSVIEFEKLVQLFKKEHSEYWQPNEERVHIDEVFDDDEEFESLESLLSRLPALEKHLETIAGHFGKNFGHNGPPDEFALRQEDIQAALTLVSELRRADVRSLSPKEESKLKKLGAICLEIGQACLKYVGKKSDLFLEGFVHAAGPAAGKWSVRALTF